MLHTNQTNSRTLKLKFKHNFNIKLNWVGMKANMGKGDKTFRMILGATLIVLGLYFQSWWGAIGLIPIITSFISWCPFYVPLKISTISKQKE